MREATGLLLLPTILSSYVNRPALHCRETKGRKQKSCQCNTLVNTMERRLTQQFVKG